MINSLSSNEYPSGSVDGISIVTGEPGRLSDGEDALDRYGEVVSRVDFKGRGRTLRIVSGGGWRDFFFSTLDLFPTFDLRSKKKKTTFDGDENAEF